MKISKQTLDVLKNFATINQNILFTEGKTLTTRTVAKTMFGTANVDTEFPREFGIYNLGSLLGVMSLFSDPDIELGEKSMTISQGKNKVTYMYASKDVLDFPDKVIKIKEVAAQFELSEENLKSLLKAGAILSSTDLKISGDGKTISCTVLDPKNSAANTFTVEVGTTDRQFDAYIKMENMKMTSGKYTVILSEAPKITQFRSDTVDYSLYIANERNTTWVAA